MIVTFVFQILVHPESLRIDLPNILYVYQGQEILFQSDELVIIFSLDVVENGDSVAELHHVGMWGVVD